MTPQDKDIIISRLVRLLREDEKFFNAVIKYANSAYEGCLVVGGK